MDAAPRPKRIPATAVLGLLRPGELVLSLRHIGSKTHAFLLGDGRVRHRVIERGDAFGPWTDRIAKSAHLYWIAGNVRWAETLDTMPLGGAPLAERVAQSRLPFAGLLAAPRAQLDGPPVVVADPEGNLRWARDEATHLGGHRLEGSAAHRDAVLAAVRGARVLHFAGHGVLRPDAPWDAHLRLADQTRLSLGDLLTARPAIGTVILNGCSTGIHLDLGGEERIGLPVGFLLAGAGMVLATRRDVPDADARRFIERFYAAGGADQPALAFRDAVRASRAAADPVWRDFELMGRP